MTAKRDTLVEMRRKAADRVARAKDDTVSPAFVNIWVKLGTKIRDELARLRGVPLAVLIYLASRMDKKYQCNPGVKLIAKQTGYSERQVQRALRFLQAEGYITYAAQPYGAHSRQPTNVYTICKRYHVKDDDKTYQLFEYGKHGNDRNADGIAWRGVPNA